MERPEDIVERHGTDEELFERLAASGDPELRAELIERFVPLARTIAARFRRPREPLDDLEQVAALALVKAVDRYEPARGIPFGAFAVPTITGEIRRFFRDTGWTVRPPRDLLERALRVEKAVAVLTDRDGRVPTVPAVAAHLDLDEEEVLEARYARQGRDAVSMQEPISDEEGASTREDRLGREDRNFHVAEDRVLLSELLRGATLRERRAVALRYAGDMTQAEVGEALGLSAMQASRVVRSGLEHMEESATTRE